MKIIVVVLTVALALLSAAAGVAKLAFVPEEVEFLTGFGFSEIAIFIYGGIQVVGALLMIFPKTAVLGAVVVLLSFILSTVLLFLNGDFAFASVSLLPIALNGFVLVQLKRTSLKPSETDT